MSKYKQAFDELYNTITSNGNEAIRLQALNIKEKLLEEQATPKKEVSTITKEEFNEMGYSERVEFKKKYPNEYQTMIGGR